MPLFEFQQTFDGSQQEVSLEERELVRRAFKSFTDDVLLNHPSETLGANGYNHLFLRGKGNDGKRVDILINNWPEDPNIDKSARRDVVIVPLAGLRGKKRSAEGVTYSLLEDEWLGREGGEVIRYDSADLGAKKRLGGRVGQKILSLAGMGGSNLGSEGQPTRMDEANERANRELEERMGFNGQPIGMAEMTGLIEMVNGAQVYLPS
ncbi:MAG TPA: hypothetical protein VLG37_04520 [Candidatus Saccharimonadales bacterium]|nr:hypothetical protein [Candidatus Saccharimonadales bacterium]